MNILQRLKKIGFHIAPADKPGVFFGVFLLTALYIKCIYFQLTTRLVDEPLNSHSNRLLFMASLATLLVVYSLVTAFFKKFRVVALVIVDVLLSILLISDTIYFRYYSNAITIPVLLQIGLIGPLGESIRTLLKSSDILYLIDFPFLVAGLILMGKKRKFALLSWKRRLITSAVGIAAGLILFASVYHDTNTLWFDYDKNYVAKQLGILYFHFFDTQSYFGENVFVSKTMTSQQKDEVKAYLGSKPAAGNELKGIAKGKNLIIVQLEAFQQFVLNRKVQGEEITPNLNKLLKDSLYFDNFYYQVGEGNTSDAEFLCNNSLYPAKEGAAYFRYPSNTYHALPQLLKEQGGYNTFSFHAYHPSFWNRTVMHKKLGFDRFFSEKDFEPGMTIGFGLNDTTFLVQSVDKLAAVPKPFYGFMITLSSHYAYAPFQNDSFNVGEYDGTDFGNYLRAAHYVDMSIGEFISELKKKGLYDNTILAFYGDHFMMPKNNSKQFRDFLNIGSSDLLWTENEKVPLIIHYPGVKNGITSHATGGEIDILPTVANLLDISAPDAMGKDLINTQKGYAVLRNGSVVTDDFVYVNETREFYAKANGVKLDTSTYSDELKKLQHQLDVSDIILTKDAFKTVK